MDTGIRLKLDLTGLLDGVGKTQESELSRAIIDQAVETIKALTEQVENRTTLLSELFDYVGRLESSMVCARSTPNSMLWPPNTFIV